MDLRETEYDTSIRHPWETVRAWTIKKLLQNIGNIHKMLDVGCGDAHSGSILFDHFTPEEYIGYDSHLTDTWIQYLSKRHPALQFTNSRDGFKNEKFDLILLLDVLEHVADDSKFLTQFADYQEKGGHILITAPAFQSLFGSHDRFLKHYRRYNFYQLSDLIKRSDCNIIAGGYLFATPLLVRCVARQLERLKFLDATKREHPAAKWNHGPFLTGICEFILKADNLFMLSSSLTKFRFPGLSVWALCKR